MSTPPSSPGHKRVLNGTPKNVNLSKVSSENNIFLNNYLYKNIPILKNQYLFNSVLEYCKQLKKYTKSDKEYYLKQGIIKKINSELIQLKNNYEKINSINSNSNIINKNNKIIKRHELKADGLIEGIINCAVHYYSNDSTVKSNLKISTNNKFYQIMNKANGNTLSEFIIELYNSDIPNKNLFLLDVLKIIALKLDNLQNSCDFIHGDLHSGNIFINYENNTINITFIDFGYTTIKFPNKNDLLISGITESNLQRKYQLNLKEEPLLRAVDLFHLIQDLESYKFSLNKKEYHKFDLFFDLINKIQNIYFKNFDTKLLKKYKSNHFFTSSNDFYSKKNIEQRSSFEILIPENFIINISDLVNINNNNNKLQESKVKGKGKGLFGNNNNNNKLQESKVKGKGLFGNNN
jgi:hypothetical protein